MEVVILSVSLCNYVLSLWNYSLLFWSSVVSLWNYAKLLRSINFISVWVESIRRCNSMHDSLGYNEGSRTLARIHDPLTLAGMHDPLTLIGRFVNLTIQDDIFDSCIQILVDELK
jgi:hypothetical protein